jgi:hypothetical protein
MQLSFLSSFPCNTHFWHFYQYAPSSCYLCLLLLLLLLSLPILVAARSKAWVCGLSLAGIGFESRLRHGCLSLVSVVSCQVEVPATGWSLVQRNPTECGVSECDSEASIMSRPWPTMGCCAVGNYYYYYYYHNAWSEAAKYWPLGRLSMETARRQSISPP